MFENDIYGGMIILQSIYHSIGLIAFAVTIAAAVVVIIINIRALIQYKNVVLPV